MEWEYISKTPIHIPRHVNYLELKNSYYGGRVEVFKGYVVSLYPTLGLGSPLGREGVS